MTRSLTLLIFSCFTICVFAQSNGDSLAYQLQRKKINDMLAVRTAKFGQYDHSLSEHTGIFGLQTKKDIRRSNDILMDIVKTDDDIFKELKILLDYRTFQQTQVQVKSAETEGATITFMATINKLRAQTDQLKTDIEKQNHGQTRVITIFILVFIFMFASILFLLSQLRKRKP